jgi:hypothetical protein
VAPLDISPTESTLEAGGHVKGVAVAIVQQNQDSEGMGRVRVTRGTANRARVTGRASLWRWLARIAASISCPK